MLLTFNTTGDGEPKYGHSADRQLSFVYQHLDHMAAAAIDSPVKYLTKKMSASEKFAFYNEYNLRKKDPAIGVSLALIVGGLGIHRFWLGEMKAGFTYLIFCWTIIPIFFAIVDAACMGDMCRKHNNQVAKELYSNIKSLTP